MEKLLKSAKCDIEEMQQRVADVETWVRQADERMEAADRENEEARSEGEGCDKI